MIISLIVNLLLAIVILRLVLKREKEIKIVYANTAAQDAEASNEHPPDSSPRVESPRAPRSASAQLSSSSQGLSAEADEVVAPLGEVGIHDEDTTAQDPIGDTGNAYLQIENSSQNRELYKSFKAVWRPDGKYWTLPLGRDLRRAYEGGWIVNGDTVYAESLRKWLPIARRAEIQDMVRRIIKDERRRARLRRATRTHG